MLTKVILTLILMCSISPRQAQQSTIKNSQKEAKQICQKIEEELSTNYTGDEFITTFITHHPYTAHFVRKHFCDHWRVEYKKYDPKWREWKISLKRKF